MDNRQLISKVAKRLNTDNKTASAMADALTQLIADRCAQLENIAIPGFGTFVALKTDEHIVTNPESKQRCLVPPQISVSFRPAVKLRKAASIK